MQEGVEVGKPVTGNDVVEYQRFTTSRLRQGNRRSIGNDQVRWSRCWSVLLCEPREANGMLGLAWVVSQVWRRGTVGALAFVCLAMSGAAGGAFAAALPNPPELRTQVEFWKKIFAEYSRNQVVIHDTWELDRIYSVLDFSAEAADLQGDILPAYVEIRVSQEKERIRSLLLRLHQNDGKPQPWSEEERRIAALFRRDPNPEKFLVAADPARIRAQRGLREKFAEGLRISGRYLPAMEAIFRAEGLPEDLTRLPLVESCFDVRAYSKVGAAGIWQFIPETGRRFLRIDAVVDERRDPIESSKAAAAFLKENYAKLGTWPLAVTAYNHGPAGMLRAVEAVGSRDLVEIIRRYQGPRFGFASRNFYAELLAAIEVEREHEKYFGRLRRLPPLSVEEVGVPRPTPFRVLAHSAAMPPEDLAELNLALTPSVVRGEQLVPAGFRLRVPRGRKSSFEARYAAWVADQERTRLARGSGGTAKPAQGARRSVARADAAATRKEKRTHKVKRGQTVETIARMYGLSAERLARRNGLRRGSRLRTGQVLVIPEG